MKENGNEFITVDILIIEVLEYTKYACKNISADFLRISGDQTIVYY